jgi:hypothetical protein
MNKYQNLDSVCPSLSLFGERMLQNYAQQATPNIPAAGRCFSRLAECLL